MPNVTLKAIIRGFDIFESECYNCAKYIPSPYHSTPSFFDVLTMTLTFYCISLFLSITNA